MPVRLGCIADDFTGATDLANNLVRAGMRVVQTINVPAADTVADADAVVIALKSRTIGAADAVAQSRRALAWLRSAGAQQIYFKYCSTFDSTPEGNIGPVIDALMDDLGTDFTIATPAFPDNGRSVFKGHLFVGDRLLSESGMKDHPLTPMTDPDLIRVLSAQTRHQVGLIDYATVAAGRDAVRARIDQLHADGVGIAIVDAISNNDLLELGLAIADLRLVTAGSGVAIALPANWGFRPSPDAAALPAATGLQAIVSGSVSVATNTQVAEFHRTGRPSFQVDALRIAAGQDVVTEALAFGDRHLASGPVLFYSTQTPSEVRAVQNALGATEAGSLVEDTLARIAVGLVKSGVGQLVVAGGETSGAVVQELGIGAMRIGPQIDPGVPWCAATLPDGRPLHITLKSGNFGTPDFFTKALAAKVLAEMSDLMEVARDEICRVGASLFARGYVHASAGNISARVGDEYLVTPTDAPMGFLEAERISHVDADGNLLSGDRASKALILHRRIYSTDPNAAFVIHTHSTHLVALTLAGVWSDDDILPPITPYYVMKVGHVPLIPYHRPGDPAVADLVAARIAQRADDAPIRAVMLDRLGPVVWGPNPAAAMAVLEELEETARLWMLTGGQPAPLPSSAIQELKDVFGAAW